MPDHPDPVVEPLPPTLQVLLNGDLNRPLAHKAGEPVDSRFGPIHPEQTPRHLLTGIFLRFRAKSASKPTLSLGAGNRDTAKRIDSMLNQTLMLNKTLSLCLLAMGLLACEGEETTAAAINCAAGTALSAAGDACEPNLAEGLSVSAAGEIVVDTAGGRAMRAAYIVGFDLQAGDRVGSRAPRL